MRAQPAAGSPRAWTVAALDVGGSSVKGGVVRTTGAGLVANDVQETRLDSTGPLDAIMAGLAAAAARVLDAAGEPAGLAIGFPGPFDYAAGVCRIRGLAKFDALYGRDVGRLLADALGRNVAIRFRNDAEAFALGEARFGAGRGHRRILCLTLGTGLGSAFVQDGRRIASGDAVPPGGELNQVVFRGQVADAVFSTRGLSARLRMAGLAGDAAQAAARALAGDAAAQAAFHRFGAELGEFVLPHGARFEAEAVILGGGIARAWPLFGPDFARVVGLPARPAARPSEASLLGAATLFA